MSAVKDGGAAFPPSRSLPLEDALDFDAFYGDETDVTPLSDKIRRAAKPYAHCQICDGPIAQGEQHRARTERNNEDRTVMTFRFCNRCTRAMAHPDTFNTGRLIDSRYAIGERRRRATRSPTP